VRVVAAPLADAEDLDALLRQLDRGAEAGGARADDEDAHGRALLFHARTHPVAARR
jgi:hypothetical protein